MVPKGRRDPPQSGQPGHGEVPEIFAALVEAAPNAMLVVNEPGEIILVNGRAEILFGYSRRELLGEPVAKLLPGLERETRKGDSLRDDLDLPGLRRDGGSFPAEISFSAITAAGRKLIATVIRDATERRSTERRLRFLAEHDVLTGLANRRWFETRLTEQIARAKRYGERAALLMIDVDRFKRINDTFGHRTGDDALRLIGHMLEQNVRVMDSVARFGGDEFAVLLPHADHRTTESVARKLHDAVATQCTLSVAGHGDLPLSVSIGAAPIDKTTEDEHAALRVADGAMYEEKRRAIYARHAEWA